MPALSVVIPALDEARALPLLLADLAQQTLRCECVVVDGGSRDETTALAEAAGVRVLCSERGRGVQMNAGARAAQAEYLLFLHADTRLTHPALLAEAVHAFTSAPRAAEEILAGHFALRFERHDERHARLFAFMEAKTRSGRPGTINGDQGCLIARADFEQLGGYDTRLPFLEDQRLAHRVHAQGRWLLLPGHLFTSARRFEAEGHAARYALMGLTMLMHEAGLEAFFDEAPELYREQSQAAALDLAPFLNLARQHLWRALRQRPALALSLGRYVRGNAWQLALALDLRAGTSASMDWQTRFDERLAHLLDNRASDAIAAALLLVLLHVPPPGRLRRRA